MEGVKRVRFRAVVTGWVQGVYYRASCRERAVELELSGWVRNRADGAVELEAQGPADRVEALLAWCRQGPARARVESIEVTEIELAPSDSGFWVRY
jgi:acylphosphatase